MSFLWSTLCEVMLGMLPAFVAVALVASTRDDYYKERFEGRRFALLRAVRRQVQDTLLFLYEDLRYGGEEAFNRRLRKYHPEAAAKREKVKAKQMTEKGAVSLPVHAPEAGNLSEPEGEK